MLLVGALGMLALQALVIGGLLSPQSYDPIILNPDKNLSGDGVAMVMLCGEGRTPKGRHSEILSKMPPDGNWSAWSRGRTVRGNCDIWYHHNLFYNPHAWETCLIGCDHDILERRLLELGRG